MAGPEPSPAPDADVLHIEVVVAGRDPVRGTILERGAGEAAFAGWLELLVRLQGLVVDRDGG